MAVHLRSAKGQGSFSWTGFSRSVKAENVVSLSPEQKLALSIKGEGLSDIVLKSLHHRMGTCDIIWHIFLVAEFCH
jgi:hypothetical protein